MKRALLLIFTAGCNLGLGSDPGHAPCALGHIEADGACRLPTAAILVDGQTADWSAIDDIPLAPEGTIKLAVGECIGADCDPEVYVYARLPSAPVTNDPTIRYALSLAPTAERPAAETDVLYASSVISYTKNGVDIDPPSPPVPWSFAWTSDGFEAAIPSSFLPLRGAAIVSLTAEHDTGGTWTATTNPPPTAPACWETFPKESDPCAQR
jgi:hypothetical protein